MELSSTVQLDFLNSVSSGVSSVPSAAEMVDRVQRFSGGLGENQRAKKKARKCVKNVKQLVRRELTEH